MMKLSTWIPPIALFVVFLGGAESQAARHVQLEVELDGEVVLRGTATDTGLEDQNLVWLHFYSTELAPQGEFIMPATNGRPPHATIEGPIKIRALHGRKVLVEAVAELLTLQPYPNGPPGVWQVTPGEVLRVGKLAGISFPEGEATTGPGESLATVLDHPLGKAELTGVVLFVIVAFLVSLLVILRRSEA